MRKYLHYISLYFFLLTSILIVCFVWETNKRFRLSIQDKYYGLLYNQTFGFDKNKKILSLHFNANASGIGNRLKKMMSYLRFYNPKKLKLYWPTQGWVTSSFSDLFVFKYPIILEEINTNFLINDAHPLANPLYIYVRSYVLLISNEDFKSTERPHLIDLHYQDIPNNIKDIYLPYFTALKPSSKVQKRLNELKLPKKVISVQIRNAPDWDNYFGANEAHSSFFKIMDKYSTDTYFYISAMSKEAALPFYNRYPGRIIELPNKNYKSMIDAVADMFILGSTDDTLCALHSTFCEVAWWINGAKSNVFIVGEYKNWRKKHEDFRQFIPIIDKIN